MSPSPIAARLLAALRRDPVLFMEVRDLVAATPVAEPWVPNPGVPGAFSRTQLGGRLVALVEGTTYRVRSDVLREGGEAPTQEDAFRIIDEALVLKGWVLLPQPA